MTQQHSTYVSPYLRLPLRPLREALERYALTTLSPATSPAEERRRRGVWQRMRAYLGARNHRRVTDLCSAWDWRRGAPR